MSQIFDPRRGLVIVHAELFGPAGSALLRLALDTGASMTLVNPQLLLAVGYNPAKTSTRARMTTGSGIEETKKITIGKISALGHSRTQMPILAHALPPSIGVDGLLGLDFLRRSRLLVDFINGVVELR